MEKETSIIVQELYPFVVSKLVPNLKKYKANIANFVTSRHNELYETAPYDRIFFNKSDVDNIFKSLNMNENEVKNIIKKAFFYDINYSPSCVKEPYVMVLFCCIRYFVNTGNMQMAELSAIFTCFTGKFYASLHSSFWKTYTPRQNKAVMEYVVNNMLSDKFYLKTEGTIFGSIKKICATYLDKYIDDYKDDSMDDDLFAKRLVQQLRDREKSFLKNIASLYFEAVNNKSYMNYETDSLDQDTFRITDNDSAKAARLTEAAVSLMTSQRIDMNCAANCHDSRVSTKNIVNVLETILGDNNNIPELKWVVNVIICDFMSNYPGKDIGGAEFLSYTMKAKPNTKNQYLIKMKDIVLRWLNNSAVFRKCKSNITMNSYYRSIIMYFALIITKIANNG